MLVNDVLSDAFARIQEEVHVVVEDLDSKGLAFRPSDDANSIGWLVWHLARVQDDHISELANVEQVWVKGGWAETFALPYDKSATGYGHTSEEVAQLEVIPEQLLGYYDTVHTHTLDFIQKLRDDDYERPVDDSYDPPVTLATRLVSVLSDDLQHIGQAAFVRGLLGK